MAQYTSEFASFLKQRRESLGRTMKQVSDELGYKPEFIGMIEKGTRMPDLNRIPDFASVLGIPAILLARLAIEAAFPELANTVFTRSQKEDMMLEKFRQLDTPMRHTIISMVDRLHAQQEKKARQRRSA